MKQAKTLAEIHQSCHPRPLRPDELGTFFVPTADARDPVLSRREQLRKILVEDPEAGAKLLLAGHSGSGKSTELVKLVEELGDSFFPVTFSVQQECNLAFVPVEDVLVVMMERLVAACEEAGLTDQLHDESLKSIHDWFAQDLEIEEQKTNAGLEAEAGVDVSGTYFGKLLGLLFKSKASIRRQDERLRRKTTERPRRLGDLADLCNILIKEVRLAAQTKGKHLLVIVEDLDKVNLIDARRMFLEQPAVLSELSTNLICTIPIFLLHSPDREPLDQHFEAVVLPMLKVTNLDGSRSKEGWDVIPDIIARRVDEALIADDARELIIEKTGGVLRDAFEVIEIAAAAAESLHSRQRQADAVINVDNVRYALNRRKTEFARAISVINLPGDWNLTTDDLYARLRTLAARPVQVLPTDYASMVLLQAKAVIEYNGEQWFAVHPLVKELLELMPQ